MREDFYQNALKVSKYNPEYYDENGCYLLDEWADYSDVGSVFNGSKLTLAEYEEIESLYILAVKKFFSFYKCQSFVLHESKFFEDDIEQETLELQNTFAKRQQNYIWGLDELECVLKLIFRGYISAFLCAGCNSDITMLLSYDYYMFLNGPDINNVKKLIEQIRGLYVV